MKLFPNGLPGRLMPHVSGIDGAAALVRQTLAQHGLAMPELSTERGTEPRSPTPAPAPHPEGARFEAGRFDCGLGGRDFWLYTPASARRRPTGLIVMLHGCTQTPQDFATGTAMNERAEDHGLAVLYPAQMRGANAQTCWNWFTKSNQRRDHGEPAILAGMAGQIVAKHDIPHHQVFVGGLSAGGAMAVILAETYPEVFAAVGVHSGLPFGSASDVASAFAAMSGQATKAGRPLSQDNRRPVIVFHGTADATVHPGNGARIVRDALSSSAVQVQTSQSGHVGGRAFTRTICSAEDGPTAEHWEIDGMGHAWSGGNASGSYTDACGPDASAEMLRFFLQTAQDAK